jgi:hypothetical protein
MNPPFGSAMSLRGSAAICPPAARLPGHGREIMRPDPPARVRRSRASPNDAPLLTWPATANPSPVHATVLMTSNSSRHCTRSLSPQAACAALKREPADRTPARRRLEARKTVARLIMANSRWSPWPGCRRMNHKAILLVRDMRDLPSERGGRRAASRLRTTAAKWPHRPQRRRRSGLRCTAEHARAPEGVRDGVRQQDGRSHRNGAAFHSNAAHQFNREPGRLETNTSVPHMSVATRSGHWRAACTDPV